MRRTILTLASFATLIAAIVVGGAGPGRQRQILPARPQLGLSRQLPVLELSAMCGERLRHVGLLRHQPALRVFAALLLLTRTRRAQKRTPLRVYVKDD